MKMSAHPNLCFLLLGCCGPLLSEKPVTVQTVPGFVSIETSSLRGSVLTAAGDEIEIGPFNSGPISVQALGSSLNYSFSTTSSEVCCIIFLIGSHV